MLRKMVASWVWVWNGTHSVNQAIEARYGYTVGGNRRIESVDDMLQLFGDHVGHVYFHHPVDPRHLDRVNSMCVGFELVK